MSDIEQQEEIDFDRLRFDNGTDSEGWAYEMHKRFPQIPEDELVNWCYCMIYTGYDYGSYAGRKEEREKIHSELMSEKMFDSLTSKFCENWTYFPTSYEEAKEAIKVMMSTAVVNLRLS